MARRIKGPRYDLESVRLLAKPEQIVVVTESCSDDLAELEWENDDVASLISCHESRESIDAP